MVQRVLNKAFFGKNNCLKATLNDQGDFYFEFGAATESKEKTEWSWKKVKMNDDELGNILGVLEGKKDSASFFHDYNGNKTQIWVSKKEDAFFIKVKEVNKSLSLGEQVVLRELLKYAVLRSNMNL